MSSDLNKMFISLEQLKKLLENAHEKAGTASMQGVELGGEFEQETSTDLDGLQVAIQGLMDDLDSIIVEAKTLWEDFDEMEDSLRAGIDDEENYKLDAEHIQEEMREDLG